MELTGIFTPLARDYARYRPGYPKELVDELERVCGLSREWSTADIGSGTGNLARVFLEDGYRVVGVEPNREMREAAERLLVSFPGFRSVEGTAERTTLDSASLDLITVGQALHWFDVERARHEFRRVLRPGGWVAVAWNDRPAGGTAFTREYVAFARACSDARPSECTRRSLSDGLEELFGGPAPHSAGFTHTQRFDLEGLLGRARSSGHVPQRGEPGHDDATAALTELFRRHQQCGLVEFRYLARLHVGRL